MSAKPWYPWYVGDARAKMRGLTLEQRGAYRELLDEYYIRGGSLPADRHMLWRIADAHTDAERAAVELVAGAFFVRQGDQLVNKRAEREIDRGRELAEFGAKGGLTKQANRVAKGLAKPLANDLAEPVAKPLADRVAPQPQTTTTSTTTTTEPPSLALTRSDQKPAGPVTAKAWDFYGSAYQGRYGVPPARNATVNAQMAQFLKRVGAEEGPPIAAWYVDSNEAFYVKKKHSVGQLLADAEKLRTEWATRKHSTERAARQADETASRRSVFTDLIEEYHGPQ